MFDARAHYLKASGPCGLSRNQWSLYWASDWVPTSVMKRKLSITERKKCSCFCLSMCMYVLYTVAWVECYSMSLYSSLRSKCSPTHPAFGIIRNQCKLLSSKIIFKTQQFALDVLKWRWMQLPQLRSKRAENHLGGSWYWLFCISIMTNEVFEGVTASHVFLSSTLFCQSFKISSKYQMRFHWRLPNDRITWK